MPCSDNYPTSTCGRCTCVDPNPELKRRLDRATRAGCDMRTILRRNNLEHLLTPETRKWIRGHDDADAKRIAQAKEKKWREDTKMKALAKLNLDERRILGL